MLFIIHRNLARPPSRGLARLKRAIRFVLSFSANNLTVFASAGAGFERRARPIGRMFTRSLVLGPSRAGIGASPTLKRARKGSDFGIAQEPRNF